MTVLVAVRVPRRFAGWRHSYRKVGTRRAQAISKVCFAGVKRGDEVRIGLGSVAPVPLFYDGAVSPIDDIRSTARYRAQVVKNLVEEFLRQP